MSRQNSEKEIVIFDGQVFQSTAWDRGMGKYSLNLLSALMKEKEYAEKEVRIVFAKSLDLAKQAKLKIAEACPGVKMDFISLEVPKVIPGEDISTLQDANKEVLNKYVNRFDASRVDFVILSLLIDQYVSAFPDGVNKVLLFYDLIPLQYSDRYGSGWAYPNYLRRYKTIFEADIILTISQTVADDLAVYTGIDNKRIKSIVGGAIERGHLKPQKPKIELPEDFILMPSGNDLRKNNFRAVQGFEEFRKRLDDNNLKLVITSYFDTGTRNRLLELSDNLIFTGNVSEEELKWMYENTQALLFVSEYEGLGLPILEAAEVNKPIVCSNLTVFNEMSTDAFYYTDQFNPSSIADGLERAISRAGFNDRKKLYSGLLKRYTWKRTAREVIDFLSTYTKPKEITHKPKLAIFAPDPSSYSAIGKVVMLTHHSLSQNFDVDYYLERGNSGNKFSRQSFLHAVANVYPSDHFTAKDYARYDAVIYHIGNSEYHFDSIKNALHLPGYLVVHDTRLKEVFEDELVRYGLVTPGRLAVEQRLDDLLGDGKSVYVSSLVNASLGVITHSEYAKEALSELFIANEGRHIKKINLPVATPKLKKKKIRRSFSVGFAGIIHRAKGLGIIDQILASPEFHDINLHIFGIPLVEPGVLERLESQPSVKIEKNLTDFEFETRLSEMDAIVSFRPNYNGETSLTVIEALRHGVVPIVRRVGWFDELPDDVVKKVESEEEVLVALKQLVGDNEQLNALQLKAKEYAKRSLDYTQYSEGVKDLITNTPSNTINYNIATALKHGKSKNDLSILLNESY